jgi:hypothetical protein
MTEKRFKALSLLTFHALVRVHKAHDPDWVAASASPKIKKLVAQAHAGEQQAGRRFGRAGCGAAGVGSRCHGLFFTCK